MPMRGTPWIYLYLRLAENTVNLNKNLKPPKNCNLNSLLVVTFLDVGITSEWRCITDQKTIAMAVIEGRG